MIKPILIPTDNISEGWCLMKSKSNHITYYALNSLGIQNSQDDRMDIILVDTKAEIIEGDLCAVALWGYECEVVDKPTVDMINAEMLHNGHVKIISSTNKSHNLPQLSNTSKLLLINYYNEHKCMPENVEVEHQEGFYEGIKDIIVLNQRGEVDITIPEESSIESTLNAFSEASDKLINNAEVEEKLYTRKEMRHKIISFYLEEDNWDEDDVEKWLSKNLNK